MMIPHLRLRSAQAGLLRWVLTPGVTNTLNLDRFPPTFGDIGAWLAKFEAWVGDETKISDLILCDEGMRIGGHTLRAGQPVQFTFTFEPAPPVSSQKPA